MIPARWASWIATYGFIEDVASGIVLALDHPHARNRTYNLGEPDLVDHFEWAKRFAASMDWGGEIQTNDEESGTFAGLDLSVPLKLDTSRIREELGFSERVHVYERVARTVEAERPFR